MIRRKYSRRYASLRKIALSILLVSALAVATGYAATEFIIKPYILGSKTETPINEDSSNQGGREESDFTGSSIINKEENPITNPGGAEETAETNDTSEEDKDIGEDVKREGAKALYAIQYGSFTDLAAAEKMSSTLASSAISVTILEKEGAFKLIGQPFFSKDEARATLEKVRETVGDEPFITEIEVRMR